MADESRADLVMRFTDKGGGPVLAESTLDVADHDSLMKGFEPAKSADRYSNFFEVKSFNFAIAVKPQDKGVGAISKHAASSGGRASAVTDEFMRWRSATEDEYRKIYFPVEFDTFSFTRVLDAASMQFFTSCCNSVSFYSASLVKRVSVGTAGSDAKKPKGFLRFDFRDVLLTGVSWDDGDLVNESCTFVCRAMRVRYKQQSSDGSLPELASSNAVWPHLDPLNPSSLDAVVQTLVREVISV